MRVLHSVAFKNFENGRWNIPWTREFTGGSICTIWLNHHEVSQRSQDKDVLLHNVDRETHLGMPDAAVVVALGDEVPGLLGRDGYIGHLPRLDR